MKRLLAALLLGLWAALAPAADELVPVPALAARVTDLTGTLSAEQAQRLEARLAEQERAKGSQIAVLLLPSTRPETIEEFGIRLADAWKIGRKGIDDGVIVIVAKDDRRLRLEVGYGLEGVLNDAVSKRIVSETMLPHFKQGDYFGGLQAGIEAIAGVIEGEALPAPGEGRRGQGAANDGWLIWIVAAVLLASLARSLLGIAGSFGAAGLAGFFAFGTLGGWWIAALAAVAVFLLSFVPLSFFLHAAGGFGRGGGWGSGGGGFGGRGGGFGGGGASGRW